MKEKMDISLSSTISNILELCSDVAFEFGFKIYLIGGVVRDLFLDKQIFDVDITVEGNAIEFCHKLAEKKLCKILQVQTELKTVKVLFSNDVEIDFASTRKEYYPRRGHLPVISAIGCSLQEDVCRRDFTVNALAISLNKDDYGLVIDFVNGIEDINNKILRVLHDDSFNEDPSRIIRCLKFAARFGFHRDEETKKLQYKYINEQLHDDISWSRLKSELKQAFSLNNPRVYDMFIVNETYKIIFGDKNDIKGLEIQNLIDKYQPSFDWLVYLGLVMNNTKVIDALCFTRAEKKVFLDRDYLLNNSLSVFNENHDIYKFFNKRSLESVLIYYLLTKRKEPLIYLEKLSKIRVELDGNKLIALGVEDGKQIGQILDEILKRKLAGSITNIDDEINFVKLQIK